jgi:hypothetical protein
MAQVTGPIGSLPGSRHKPPAGTRCDYHPERLAVARVQGETDSFGSEMEDVCEPCLKARRLAAKHADTSGQCDWCKSRVDKRFTCRDYEEGSSGPVYHVCQPCIDKRHARLVEEDRLSQERYGDWD